MLKRLLVIALSLCVITAHAGAKNPLITKVVLSSIKQIKKTERHGDELYLSVTSFPSKGKAAHKRYPNYPLFWPGRNIDKIRSLEVWQGNLKQGAGVRLLISLIEQDSPPWNIDDEIGSVDLKLHNDKGRLQIEWQRPNRSDNKQVTIKGMKDDLQIQISGHEQSYEVTFKIVSS